MRFTLKWMLAAIAFVALGCVALYNANEAWAIAATGLTVVLLLSAVLGAIYSRPRAFYIGVCVFLVGDTGYLLLASVPEGRELKLRTATNVLLGAVREPMTREVVGYTNTLPKLKPAVPFDPTTFSQVAGQDQVRVTYLAPYCE